MAKDRKDAKGGETKSAKVVRLVRRRCPICAKPAVEAYHPFCSKRCADIDLGRWLGGDYRIASEEEADLDEASPDDAD